MRRLRGGGVDLRMFGQAIPLLVRNPALVLAPIFTGVLDIVIQEFARVSGADISGFTGGIYQFLIFVIDAFGLAVSLCIADAVWRRGRGSFDEGWEEGRRKAGDIFFAALGLSFIPFVANQLGSLINAYLGIALYVVAFFFFIYALPAASIGSIPGMASLNVSIERVRANYPMAIALSICFIVLYWLVGMLVVPMYTLSLGIGSLFLTALVKAVILGYFALVLARGYNDVSYR
ncbi:MAG: hypothetical protein JO101_02220 [Candidatus Eremiobacteraeota bacterium]|nr:hypothetical protein [Candidatus Eremiobacteraeota bacterium]MBV8354109.1 hypothetical protein [Candidatus Eremiobacteraeota bacterium]